MVVGTYRSRKEIDHAFENVILISYDGVSPANLA